MSEIFIVRHWETDYNVEKRYCGSSAVDLNNNGTNQVVETIKDSTRYGDMILKDHLFILPENIRSIFQFIFILKST